jgi:hypothetical protein
MGRTLGNAEGCRLRFIFNGAVVSLAVATDATIEDIARILGSLPRPRYGDPFAIDLTLQSRRGVRDRRSFCRSIGAWPRIVSSRYSASEQRALADRYFEENERADSGYDAR